MCHGVYRQNWGLLQEENPKAMFFPSLPICSLEHAPSLPGRWVSVGPEKDPHFSSCKT